jgi:hypothetical protein
MSDEASKGSRTPAHDAWVARVLGIDVSRAAAAAPRVDVRVVWREAKEATDAALNDLAAELRTYGDPDLERIADFGLFGLGRNENVMLNKALIEFSTAAPERRPAAAKKLGDAVGAYRRIIASPLVADIDANPFNVRVGVRETLGRALDQIERAAA